MYISKLRIAASMYIHLFTTSIDRSYLCLVLLAVPPPYIDIRIYRIDSVRVPARLAL